MLNNTVFSYTIDIIYTVRFGNQILSRLFDGRRGAKRRVHVEVGWKKLASKSESHAALKLHVAVKSYAALKLYAWLRITCYRDEIAQWPLIEAGGYECMSLVERTLTQQMRIVMDCMVLQNAR